MKTPKQEYAEFALRQAKNKFDLCHRQFMNLSLFDKRADFITAKAELAQAREEYCKAMEAAHPDWIVL